MAKVYDSPTTNLFALLADEADQSQAKKKANASKGQGQELTPKERAAAKAVQDAERKKQQEAEKAKKVAEAERRKNIELVDDTGFAQQRHQRIKESRVHPAPAEGAKGPKGEGKPKGQGKPFPKSEGSPKNVEKFNKGPKGEGKSFAGKPEGKGKGELKGEGKPKTERPARGREFDKHSQGVLSRKPQAKKGGHGKGNWDKAVPAEEATKEVKETKETEEVTEATPAVEGEAAQETTEQPATEQKAEEEEEEDKGITLDEYQKIQDEKKKELEALLGSTAQAQPRTLSEDEKKALAKFTLVENTKDQKPVKAQNTTAAPKKQNKGPIVLEINPQLPPIHGSGERRGKGRFNNKEGGNRGNNQNQQKKARVAKPAKLPRGGNFDAAFPALG